MGPGNARQGRAAEERSTACWKRARRRCMSCAGRRYRDIHSSAELQASTNPSLSAGGRVRMDIDRHQRWTRRAMNVGAWSWKKRWIKAAATLRRRLRRRAAVRVEWPPAGCQRWLFVARHAWMRLCGRRATAAAARTDGRTGASWPSDTASGSGRGAAGPVEATSRAAASALDMPRQKWPRPPQMWVQPTDACCVWWRHWRQPQSSHASHMDSSRASPHTTHTVVRLSRRRMSGRTGGR